MKNHDYRSTAKKNLIFIPVVNIVVRLRIIALWLDTLLSHPLLLIEVVTLCAFHL